MRTYFLVLCLIAFSSCMLPKPSGTTAKSNTGVSGIQSNGSNEIQDMQAPTPPQGLQAQLTSSSSAILSWSASSDDTGVTGYEVYMNNNLVGSSTPTSHSISNMLANTTYVFSVRALDAAGNFSSFSTPVQVTTAAALDTQAPTIPQNLQANANGSSSASLSWNASSDNVGVTGYSIYRDGNLLTQTTSTTYADNSLDSSTTYSYSVAAYDAAGNSSAQSNAVQVTTTAAPTSNTKLTLTLNNGDILEIENAESGQFSVPPYNHFVYPRDPSQPMVIINVQSVNDTADIDFGAHWADKNAPGNEPGKQPYFRNAALYNLYGLNTGAGFGNRILGEGTNSLPYIINLTDHPRSMRFTYINEAVVQAGDENNSAIYPAVERDLDQTVVFYKRENRPDSTDLQPPATFSNISKEQFKRSKITDLFSIFDNPSFPVAQSGLTPAYVYEQICTNYFQDANYINRSSGRWYTNGIGEPGSVNVNGTPVRTYTDYPAARERLLMDYLLTILAMPMSQRAQAIELMECFVQNFALNLLASSLDSTYASAEGGGQFATSMLGSIFAMYFFQGNTVLDNAFMAALQRNDDHGFAEQRFLYRENDQPNGKPYYGYGNNNWINCLINGSYQYCTGRSAYANINHGEDSAYNATFYGVISGVRYLMLQYPALENLLQGETKAKEYFDNAWNDGLIFYRAEDHQNYRNDLIDAGLTGLQAEDILNDLQGFNGPPKYSYHNLNVINWFLSQWGQPGGN